MSRMLNLFWPLVSSIVFGILAVFSTASAIQDHVTDQQFLCCSVEAQAQVINLRELNYPFDNYPTASINFHVVYAYKAPQQITKDEVVSQNVYAGAIPGGTIAVRYLTTDSAISRISENTYRYPNFELAFLWWLALVPALRTFIAKLHNTDAANS